MGLGVTEPPDAGNFFKNSSYKVLQNSYFCGFGEQNFWKIFLFTIKNLKICVGILLFY